MENIYDQQISLLNSLMEINYDRADGYHKAAEIVNEDNLKSLFAKLSNQSFNFAEELSEYVNLMGGEPNYDNSAFGKSYRLWMDVAGLFSGKSTKEILEFCELAEKNAVHVYEVFLKDEDAIMLPLECIAIIQEQQANLKIAYQKIRILNEVYG